MKAANQETDSSAVRSACPVCAAPSSRAVPDSPNYLRCTTCEVVYRRRIAYSTSDHWDLEYYSDERVIDYYARRLSGFKEIVGIMTQLVDGAGRWLDVGCGLGPLLQVAQSQGWVPLGIEPSSICVELALKRLGSADIVQGTAEDSLAKFQNITVVSFIDVLRHVGRPSEVLANTYNALEPDGWILIREARADILRKDRLRESTAKRGAATWFLQEWNADSLETALRSAGFRNVHSITSPTFTETAGSERVTRNSIKNQIRRIAKLGLWPASRLIHRASRGRVYITPNFISLGQK